jgi:hypothetical protein
MKGHDIAGTLICWGFTAVLALINVYYLVTLGETSIVAGKEIARPVMIGISLLFDVGLVWSTSAALHHMNDRNITGLAGSVILWALCAGFSAHSASATITMFTGSAQSKLSASLEGISVKRESLRNERNHLKAIQDELLKAPMKRRADELRVQEAEAESKISRMEAELPKIASKEVPSEVPREEFVKWLPIILVSLPVLAAVALRRKAAARETFPVIEVMKPEISGWNPVEVPAEISYQPTDPSGNPSGNGKRKKRGNPISADKAKKASGNNVVPFKSKPTKSQVEKMVSAGKSQAEIADHFGYSVRQIRNILKPNGTAAKVSVKHHEKAGSDA